MSAFGHKLEFDKGGHATCPESGQRYRLEDGVVTKV
jgi:UDP-2-acetamido-3-amino-2,3-dideoxy-glucuronate N-acetyltransferase